MTENVDDNYDIMEAVLTMYFTEVKSFARKIVLSSSVVLNL